MMRFPYICADRCGSSVLGRAGDVVLPDSVMRSLAETELCAMYPRDNFGWLCELPGPAACEIPAASLRMVDWENRSRKYNPPPP
jgi:hypothetical protein